MEISKITLQGDKLNQPGVRIPIVDINPILSDFWTPVVISVHLNRKQTVHNLGARTSDPIVFGSPIEVSDGSR